MIDYNPAHWRSTRIRRAYVYLMKFNEIRTIQALKPVKCRIADRRFYLNMSKRGDKWYWGWIAFTKPLHPWDAMEAGLVPIFNTLRG